MAICGLTTSRTGFADYRSLTAQTNGASRVQAELQAASIRVKDIIITGSVEAAEAVAQRLSKAEAAIAEALAVITDVDTRSHLEPRPADIAAYTTKTETHGEREECLTT